MSYNLLTLDQFREHWFGGQTKHYPGIGEVLLSEPDCSKYFVRSDGSAFCYKYGLNTLYVEDSRVKLRKIMEDRLTDSTQVIAIAYEDYKEQMK